MNEYAMLSKLYILAEKLMDETTKDVALSQITARAAEPDADGQLCCPATDSIQIIYDGTPVGSPARQLIVKLYTNLGTESLLTDDVDALPKDFLYDLSRNVLKVRPLPSYHDRILNDNKSLRRELEGAKPFVRIRPTPSPTFDFGSPPVPRTFGPRTSGGLFGAVVGNSQG